MMFAATTRRMGPVEDWAPLFAGDDDERENRRTPPVPDSPTLRTQEAVQQKHGTHFGEASSCSGRGNQDQVTTLMKRSFNSL
jgi:hypothetical protein